MNKKSKDKEPDFSVVVIGIIEVAITDGWDDSYLGRMLAKIYPIFSE